MSIRIRKVDGVIVALCAVESEPLYGDIDLDDAMHEALAVKFSNDWGNGPFVGQEPWTSVAEGQKVRDAKWTFAIIPPAPQPVAVVNLYQDPLAEMFDSRHHADGASFGDRTHVITIYSDGSTTTEARWENLDSTPATGVTEGDGQRPGTTPSPLQMAAE